MRARDAVIIGGGVIGGAVAHYLSCRGMDVALCDLRDIAGGTSGACDGHVLAIEKRPGFDSHMTLKSQRLLEELASTLPHDIEHRAWGSIMAVDTEDDLPAAQDFVRRQAEAGVAVEIMDRDDIRADAPALGEHIVGGVLCRSDSMVNPMALAHGLAESARRAGAAVLPFTEVTGIHRDQAGAVTGVHTARGTIPTRLAVCAAGVWSPSVARMVGVDLPITPRRGHILVSERGKVPYWRNLQEFGYMKAKRGGQRDVSPEMEKYGVALVFETTAAGNFLVGSSREFVGFDRGVNPDIVKLIAHRAVSFFPGIRDVSVIRAYTGFRPYTPDHRPVVSWVHQVPGFFVAAGHEGDGISLAAVTGHLVADLITGAEPIVDPAPLSLDRFGGGMRQ